MLVLAGDEAGAIEAAFHDVFVEFRVDRDGVIAVETGHAEVGIGLLGGADHGGGVEVADGIGAEVLADLVHGALIGEEVAGIGEIDAVMACVLVRGTGDAHVDLLGAGLAKIDDAGAGRGAADDGVIDDDDTPAGDGFLDEVELYADIEVANQLGGLEEGAANVMVADEGVLEGDAKLLGEAESGVGAGIRDGDDEVRLDGVKAGELAAHGGADTGDVDIGDDAVRAGEVHVLEDAEGFLLLGKGKFRADAGFIDDHDLAGFDLEDELGVDEIEGAGLAGEDVGAIELAEDEGPEAEGIADADDLALAHDDEGKGALDLAQGAEDAGGGVRLGEEVEDDLAIDGGLEDGATLLKLLAEEGGVDEVPVMADGELAATALAHERLGVLDVAGAGGGIADVADGTGALEGL